MELRMDTTEVICAREAHETFAQAMAAHGNAVAAHRAAYPEATPQTAKSNAHKVANHPDVRRRVAELQAKRRAELLERTRDLEALAANMALGKAADLVDEEGQLIPLERLPTSVKDALKGVKVKVSTTKDGEVVKDIDFTFPDPIQALRLLAQLRGALIERSDVTSGGRPLPAPVTPEQLPELDRELRQRLLPAPQEDGSDLV